MSSLDGIIDHEAIGRQLTDQDFADSDLASFHEVLCDLARKAAKNPEHYSDIPPHVADALETINYQVLKTLTMISQHRVLRDVAL